MKRNDKLRHPLRAFYLNEKVLMKDKTFGVVMDIKDGFFHIADSKKADITLHPIEGFEDHNQSYRHNEPRVLIQMEATQLCLFPT